MEAPRNKKWVDGQQGYLWPVANHIGWAVQTAGRVDLDMIEPKNINYNQGDTRVLPGKTIVGVLKHIDEKGRAYVYDMTNGVMMMPQELLEPVGK